VGPCKSFIGAISIELTHTQGADTRVEEATLKLFVESFKKGIRQDDMLVHWSDSKFLLIYLVDDVSNIKQVAQKAQKMLDQKSVSGLKYKLSSASQDANESVSKLIKRV